MDPLTAIALGGGGLYLLRRKQTADAIEGPIELPTKNYLPKIPTLPPKAMSMFVTNIIAAEQVVPGTTGDHTYSDVEGELFNRVFGGGVSVNVVQIVVQAVAFMAILGLMFGTEVERLSRGRPWYRNMLKTMAETAALALKTQLSKANALTEQQLKDFTNLFGYYVAKGYNRANLAWCDTLTGNLLDSFSHDLPQSLRIGYWADRACCLPEKSYVKSVTMNIPGFPRQMSADEGSLEYLVLDAATEEQVQARLPGVWSDLFFGVADFVGRAIACTWQQPNPGSFASSPDLFYTYGCIGRTSPDPVPVPAPDGTSYGDDGATKGYYHGNVAALKFVNFKEKSIRDASGLTNLRWMYGKSYNLQHAVVEE